jgi:hypothetical protein
MAIHLFLNAIGSMYLINLIFKDSKYFLKEFLFTLKFFLYLSKIFAELIAFSRNSNDSQEFCSQIILAFLQTNNTILIFTGLNTVQ